jgi:hypothetical protein
LLCFDIVYASTGVTEKFSPELHKCLDFPKVKRVFRYFCVAQ